MRAIEDTKSDLTVKKICVDWFGSLLKRLCNVGIQESAYLNANPNFHTSTIDALTSLTGFDSKLYNGVRT